MNNEPNTADNNRASSRGQEISRRGLLRGAGGAAVAGLAWPLLQGCGDDDESTATEASGGATEVSGGASTASEGQVGKITMWSQNYGPTPESWSQFTKESADAFNAGESGEVDWQVVPWANALQKWDLAMSNCSTPDVADMFFLQSRIVQGGDECSPLDITAEVESGTFGDWERFVPVAQREASFEGKIYGVPWRIDSRGLVYRSDLWQPVSSLDEFEAQALELVGSEGLVAAAQVGGGNVPYQALRIIGAAWGVEPLSEDMDKSILDDDRWFEACTWLQEMVEKKVFFEAGVTDQRLVATDTFRDGRIALAYGGGESLRAVSVGTDLEGLVSAQTMPVGPSGESTGIASIAPFSIFGNAGARDTALQWVAFLAETEMATKMSSASATMSPDRNVQAAAEADDFIQTLYEVSETAFGIDMPTPKWTQLTAVPEGPLSKLTLEIFTGEDVRASLSSAHEAVQAVLDS